MGWLASPRKGLGYLARVVGREYIDEAAPVGAASGDRYPDMSPVNI
jgi:hypothetical protein